MRFSVVFAIVAFLAISVVTAFPSTNSSNDTRSTIRPFPRFPPWWGIGPVIFNTTTW
ncbi:hypothetical protein KR084_000451 [Drosophila pseudotakahashii]|nr:hypothetical protein KR084_000451 [Drosophila pseudotakahashii]